ncbi:hypothetical protein Mhun_0401 [Methanospirillum hungatei JF-1]|uniref:Uncharacterized protein n=1 Tax=Methanospirillum hungatei JF-1 (strain ATCC 27890 / DSM 864 / NBRC 100397 / JF-1) TaxID=323259 RepID=Q2FML9_METHJ|nr:hypothetical protein [Methanospirillum hungatei]ABD40166.1 hypothetical protein Mhun_0401 [Methanospirillum hungatei JF-1]
MTISKKPLIIGCIVSWLIIIITFMFLARSFDIEVLFILWLIGILIIAELIDTRYVRPGYARMIMIIAGAGTVLFGIIVLRKVWVILYG